MQRIKTKNINGDEYKILISHTKLRGMIKLIAQAIGRDYPNKANPPVLLVVLTGGMYFGTMLSMTLERLGILHKVDTVIIKRYSSDEQTKDLQMVTKPSMDFTGRNVIVVEDLIEEGITLNYLHKFLMEQNPNTVEYCVMAVKEKHHPLDFTVKYKVLEDKLPSNWLVGFGLDSEQLHRGLEDVWVKSKNNS